MRLPCYATMNFFCLLARKKILKCWHFISDAHINKGLVISHTYWTRKFRKFVFIFFSLFNNRRKSWLYPGSRLSLSCVTIAEKMKINGMLVGCYLFLFKLGNGEKKFRLITSNPVIYTQYLKKKAFSIRLVAPSRKSGAAVVKCAFC